MPTMSKATAKTSRSAEMPVPEGTSEGMAIPTPRAQDPATLPCGIDCRWGCEPDRKFGCRQGFAAGSEVPVLTSVDATGTSTGASVAFVVDARGTTLTAVETKVDAGAWTAAGATTSPVVLTVAGAAGSEHFVQVRVRNATGWCQTIKGDYFTKTA